MSNQNIFQLKSFSKLKDVVQNRLDVVLGMTCPDTDPQLKALVKKFLKGFSKQFPLVTFIFMDLSYEDIENTNLSLVQKNLDVYPCVYYIRESQVAGEILYSPEFSFKEALMETRKRFSVFYQRDHEEFLLRQKEEKAKNSVKINEDLFSKSRNDKSNRSNRSNQSNQSNRSNQSDRSNQSAEYSEEMIEDSTAVDTNAQMDHGQRHRQEQQPEQAVADTSNEEVKKLSEDIEKIIKFEQYKAIEKEYADIRKDFFDMIKQRQKMVEPEEDSDSDSNRGSGRRSKRKKKDRSEEREEYKAANPRMDRQDDVVSSSSKSKSESKKRNESRRRRR